MLYLRVSTATKSRYGEVQAFDQRPELQEAPLKELASRRGWQITQVYVDRASGAKENRPALERLLADARSRRFDLLLVWRFDRVSRSALHFLSLVEDFRGLGIDFVSHEQSLDTTTAMGKFTLTMFAALAELERQVIRERVSAGLDYARRFGTKSGKSIGRPHVIFHRNQVRVLRSEGLSWRQIALRLDVGVGTVRRAAAVPSGPAQACQNPAEGNPD